MRNAFLVIAASVLGSVPAWAIDVKTDYDHYANFEHYQTFSWKSPGSTSGRGSFDNSLLDDRLRRAIGAQLIAKHMQESDRTPDVYIVYHAAAQERNEWVGSPYGWHRRFGPGGWVSRYLQGNFVIDMVDAKTNRLIWHAIASDTGSNSIDLESEKNIAKIAEKAFKHYPPAQKG
jgi:hypothetical protein